MNDVVGFGIACEVVQLAEVACTVCERRALFVLSCACNKLTSNICNAQHSCMANLLHTSLIRVEWPRARYRAAGLWC